MLQTFLVSPIMCIFRSLRP